MAKLQILEDESVSSTAPHCPYCDSEITPDEGFYYDPDRYTEDECAKCGGKFDVEVETTTTWTTKKREGETA